MDGPSLEGRYVPATAAATIDPARRGAGALRGHGGRRGASGRAPTDVAVGAVGGPPDSHAPGATPCAAKPSVLVERRSLHRKHPPTPWVLGDGPEPVGARVVGEVLRTHRDRAPVLTQRSRLAGPDRPQPPRSV